MPAPISIIGYLVTGPLQVQFTSLSLNVDNTTTYDWDFGDGNNSADENPTHIYSTQGFYTVKLKVIKGTDESESDILLNLTGTINPNLFFNIRDLVDLYSPTQVIGTIRHHNQKDFLIAKWQNFLHILVDPIIETSNIYNPVAWEPLANSLIARLTAIDIILTEASAFAINAAFEGQGTSSSTITENSEGTSTSSGGIKSIETGPTKVERYENKDESSKSEKISNLAKAYQNLLVKDGVLDQMKRAACQEAARLGVRLEMCNSLPKPKKVFSVIKSRTQRKDLY